MISPELNPILVKAAKGRDLNDLLNHIAWTDVVKPKLSELKDYYSKLLVSSLLGGTDISKYPLTPTQLAGRVEGIDFIFVFLEGVLREGDKATATLQQEGFNFD